MFRLKRLLLLLVVLVSLTMGLYSCKTKIPPADPNAPKYINVNISNPEYGSGIGFGGTNLPTGPGYKIEITVSALDAQNNLAYFSTKTVTYSHADIVINKRDVFYLIEVSVPKNTAYVVEYKLFSQDCTWQNTKSSCARLPNAASNASKKSFRDMKTINGTNPATIEFVSDLTKKYTEDCCQ